jgi:phosphomethylpyrimidine synthase
MGKPGGRVNGSERVKITEDVRKYAAEQNVTADEIVKRGLEEKAADFVNKGSELCAKV